MGAVPVTAPGGLRRLVPRGETWSRQTTGWGGFGVSGRLVYVLPGHGTQAHADAYGPHHRRKDSQDDDR